MKKKFTRILGVSLAIALLTSLVVATAPVSALSQPSVTFPTPEDALISKADADYRIIFSLGGELGAGDTITITFPIDTIVASPTATIAASPGWIGGMWSNPTLTNPTGNWSSNATLRTVTKTLELGDAIGEDAQVRIDITGGITNPSISGSYTLMVHTSQETTPVVSSTYSIQGGWVSSDAATNISTNSATLNGTLDSLGGHTTIYVSFVWGTTSGGPYPNETSPQAMTSTGPFSANISGLSPSTIYYFAGKATDDITHYGEELYFTTRSQPIVVFPTPEDAEISRVDADYNIRFTLGKELGAGDTITITFPIDTIVASPTATIAASPGWIGGMWKNATLTSANWTYSSLSRTVTYTLDPGDEVGEAAQVRIAITGGITNPSAPGYYTLTVHTSQETTPAESNAYVITLPIIPSLEATVDFDPDTLNLKSKGKWVTVYIELPEGSNVSDIDVSTVSLNGSVMAEPKPVTIGDYDDDTLADLMVKFDRADVQDVLEPGDEVEITVSGELEDGTPFEGTDTIRVIE